MLPSCLEAHTTPSHENGDRAPCNPPSTGQHPLTPATAPSSPAVPYSEYTHAHETKEGKRKKKELKMQENFSTSPWKKSKTEPAKPLKKQHRLFLFDFLFFFPGKKVRQDKQARKETKEREESEDGGSDKNRGRLAEREAGS